MRLEIDALQYRSGLFSLKVDARLESGDFGVVLGPSGCGKSTLLGLIAGLVPAQGGRIALGGRKISGLPPEKRNLGFVFQDFALFPHLSVRQNIEYGLRRHKVSAADRRATVAELSEMFHIGTLLDRQPASLSGGEQQRVALARALAVHPDLVLMDEPLSSLDDALRRGLRASIRERVKRIGVTTLYVTHDIEEALALADVLFVMKDGVITATGRPEELVESPPDAGFVRFLSLGPLFPVTGTVLRGAETLYTTPAGIFECARGGSGHADTGYVAVSTNSSDSGSMLYFPRWSAEVSGVCRPTTEDTVSGDTVESRELNRFDARVLSSSFEGRSRRITLEVIIRKDLGTKSPLIAELEIDADINPAPGDVMSFRAPASRCRILAPAQGGTA